MILSPLWKERAVIEKCKRAFFHFLKEFPPTTCLCPKGIGLSGQKQVVGRSKEVIG